MPIPPTAPIERIGLPDATTRVIAELQKGTGLSISAISRRTGIDRRTVDKAITLIMDLQDTLRSAELTKAKIGRRYVIALKERTARARDALSSAGRKLKRG
ncbi:hypothetical protein EU546_01350 [Candidatus Thorarchaeota archaeon]|nr:MAG: hypothetical protein EU546_01350 [Candidatus Thorarchaeota archaeon]